MTVVTPCLNSGRFIEDAIRSVLEQDYPRIEYLVMDGGSTDETLTILHKYKDRLRFESAPDLGTADAVNRGFARTKGEIVAWLSADDTYLPGAISEAVSAFAEHPEAGVIYGEGLWVDGDGNPIRRYPTRPFDPDLLGKECFICQPAAFMRREMVERVNGLDPAVRTCFDYELWVRMAKFCPFVAIDQCLATSRMHPGNKTLGQRRLVFAEAFEIFRKYFGYVPPPWVYGYARCLLGRRDEFSGPPDPAVAACLLSLPIGLWLNGRQLRRFTAEWFRCMVLRRGSA